MEDFAFAPTKDNDHTEQERKTKASARPTDDIFDRPSRGPREEDVASASRFHLLFDFPREVPT